MEERDRAAFALVRPPGHHAETSRAMGFCFFNNIAVAAAHAIAHHGLERVLIVDWDVHHGNGTQEIFYARPEVLFISLHQFPFYPGSGSVAESGSGDGEGYTLNVPLGPGADDATYAAAFDRIVAPVVGEFSPSLVLLSAGFDAHRDDPLAEMRLTAEGYRTMMERLLGALPAETPIGALLEGGYDLDALESSMTAALEALVGLAPERERSDASPVTKSTTIPSHTVSERHSRELDRALRAAAEFWRLG
jgi:acetoin utilization deacetylase AcuC-like enzyme